MSTGWSDLPPTFLSEGTWAIGQGEAAPDRLLIRELVEVGWDCPEILEVGFGPGIDVPALAELGTYTGYDATGELVERALGLFPGDFHVRDVLEMDDESRFDVVYARHVLEHVSDGEEAYRRLWRATQGCLILSWFIRPTWTTSEVGCVYGDGFAHHTYDAKRWVTLATELGAHLHRIDFDHDRTKASVWLLSREPQPELVAVMDQFAQSPEFLAATIPVPTRVNEPYESALDDMVDAHAALDNLIPIIERVPELESLADESHRVAAQVEEHLFPNQDEPDVSVVIRPVRDLKARCEALQHWSVGERVGQSQAVRDAARVLETRLIEAGRLGDPPA